MKQQPNETNAATEDMELEGGDSVANGESNPKRVREDEEENGGAKKPKVDENDKSVEEERLEKKLDQPSRPVSLGPKQFGSSVEMFDYLYKFLHFWPPNVNVNKVLYNLSFTNWLKWSIIMDELYNLYSYCLVLLNN